VVNVGLVDYDVEDRLAVIRLNRPDRLNAMSSEMRIELAEVMRRFNSSDSVRVGVITGTGRAFCAGRDMKAQADAIAVGDGQLRPRTYSSTHNIFGLSDTDKPLVAAVNGYAIGQGWYMVLDCDIRLAASNAEFGMTEIPTGALGPYWLAGAEGLTWALAAEFSLVGERVPAARLLSLGLLNAIVPPEDLMNEARRWANRLASLPPRHVQMTKQLMRRMRPMPDRDMLGREVEARNRLAGLSDSREAVLAWQEKRPARYEGR
jgi:2-(1,2-epoxy-1,2-dihydrophenyl)acetyl-CoA isomerase